MEEFARPGGRQEDRYEFADLSPEDLEVINEAQGKVSGNRGKETILLAYEKRKD